MRVVEATRFGGPEVLVVREVPDPVAGPGQVVVGVSAADTLSVETQVRRGLAGEIFPVTPPYVPGSGVAGRVRSTGAGVDPGWAGRPVVTHLAGFGGYAEQVVAGADGLIPVPDGLGLREAAALLHDGNAAVLQMETTGAGAGEWVLVTAAAGGLGTVLVQLAHAAGARVAGAARGRRKLDLVRELGADAAVDYSGDGWAERLRELTGGAGVDVVFDGVGGQVGRAALEATARGGRFSAHGAASGDFVSLDREEAGRRGVTVGGLKPVRDPAEWRRRVGWVLAEAAAGRIRPVIGQTFPLERAADAHAAIEDRAVVGKTLLLA